MKEVVPVSKLLSRELSAVGAAAVIAVFVWLTRPSRVHKLMAESAGARHAVIAIRIVLVLIAVSLLANIFGYVAMAHVLGQGTLFSAYLAVVLSTVIWVAGRAFTVLLRTEPTNRLSIVQLHRREIVQWFTRDCPAVLFITWLATTLEIFGFRNGVVSAIYSILSYEIKIGALGFTVGGLLLFLLILAVGFVIARLHPVRSGEGNPVRLFPAARAVDFDLYHGLLCCPAHGVHAGPGRSRNRAEQLYSVDRGLRSRHRVRTPEHLQ